MSGILAGQVAPALGTRAGMASLQLASEVEEGTGPLGLPSHVLPSLKVSLPPLQGKPRNVLPCFTEFKKGPRTFFGITSQYLVPDQLLAPSQLFQIVSPLTSESAWKFLVSQF